MIELGGTPGRPRRRAGVAAVRAVATALSLALCAALLAPAIAGAESTGSIGGTATGPAGEEPAEGIEVCAWDAAGGEESVGCERTDEEGKYEISDLPAGEYKVEFSAGSSEGEYVIQYYHGKSSLAEADPVAVQAGQATEGIDAEMAESPASAESPSTRIRVVSSAVSTKAGTALVTVRCPAPAGSCKGLAKLTAQLNAKQGVRKVVIGRSKFSIGAGQSGTLRLKLDSRGSALLVKAGKRGLKAQLTGSGVRTTTLVVRQAQTRGSRRQGHERSGRKG